MPQPVLAAIDPTRDGLAPAALGLMLARLTSTSLLVASAYPVDVDSVIPADMLATRGEVQASINRLDGLLSQVAEASVPFETAVIPSAGSPASALRDLAEREQASMLVIGSSPRGHVGRVLPGAVTDRLLHGAPCAVAVAPKGFSLDEATKGPRLIGVAFIDTPEGRTALARACTLASRARGLVRVFTVCELSNPVVSGMLDPLALEQVRAARKNAAAAVLRRGLDAVRIGRSAGGEVLSGHAADALAAVSQDLDLLVCGSRGYGPVKTMLLGSTSHGLVRKAACPVLVVPPGEPWREAATAEHRQAVEP